LRDPKAHQNFVMNPMPPTPGPFEHVAPEIGSAVVVSPDLVHVAQALHEEYDTRLGSDLVESEIELVATKFADAAVRGFVPLLVRRYTEEALSADCAGTAGNDHP
jgi:hypothetical protein